MDSDQEVNAHQLRPRFYQCKSCGAVLRMRIEPPFWVCRNCATKLIPADLQPCDPPAERPRGDT